MRKLMMAVCFALLAGSTLSAQEGGNTPRMRTNPEQMAKRMAGKLMLDDETSAKFIPLYEDYMQKLAECRVPKKEKGSQAAQSDKDIDENIKARFSAQEKRLDVQKSYYDKFKKVLTMRQVQQLYERPDMGTKTAFCSAPLKSRQEAGKPFAAERKINLRRLKNHSAENEKSFGADFYSVNYQTVAKNLPNVFFRSGTQG